MIAAAALAFAVSAVSAAALARARVLPMDVPNPRSLHERPVPRTGGLAVLLGLAAGVLAGGLPSGGHAAWVAGAVAGAAAASFLDDVRGLAPAARLLVHALAAGAVVAGAGLAIPRLVVPFAGDVPLGALAAPLSVLALVWMANLYNFMDGMDGFAASMTILGAATFGVAFLRAGDGAGAAVAFCLAAAAAGFLLLNRPPARLFLGDVGAVPVGFLVGVLGLRGASRGAFDAALPLIAFAPFVVDATVTLLRRLARGERVWEPHRSHWYQRLVLAGLPPRRVLALEIACMASSGALALAWQRAGDGARAGVVLALVVLFFGVSRVVARAEARAR